MSNLQYFLLKNTLRLKIIYMNIGSIKFELEEFSQNWTYLLALLNFQ